MSCAFLVIEQSCQFRERARSTSLSSTEAETISLDAGLRLEGLVFSPANIAGCHSTRSHPQCEQPHLLIMCQPTSTLPTNVCNCLYFMIMGSSFNLGSTISNRYVIRKEQNADIRVPPSEHPKVLLDEKRDISVAVRSMLPSRSSDDSHRGGCSVDGSEARCLFEASRWCQGNCTRLFPSTSCGERVREQFSKQSVRGTCLERPPMGTQV